MTAYFRDALSRANELFEPARILFLEKEHRYGEPKNPEIRSRAERDALAVLAPLDGRVHVFLVKRLGDLERSDVDIAGRDWRYQGRRRELAGRRYIIIAPTSARLDTMAHELGHFFGLCHSARFDNLMKQIPRDEKATLDKQQLAAIRRGLLKFFSSQLEIRK
ncbi:MAG: hypothetical protein GYA21_02145 [Myxococcales bacterium]|nr:hypothetical protein [Myxococcales bacterium]